MIGTPRPRGERGLANVPSFLIRLPSRWSVVALPQPHSRDGWSTLRSGEFGILPRKVKEHIPRLA